MPFEPWFRQHGEVNAGVLVAQLPALQVAEVLEHVLREERCEGSHHGGHEEHHTTQCLHGVQTLPGAQFTLHIQWNVVKEGNSVVTYVQFIHFTLE